MLIRVPAPLGDGQTTTYEILVRGTISTDLAGDIGARCFDASDGKTALVVAVLDQSHLRGIIDRLGDLNIEIESVNPSRR